MGKKSDNDSLASRILGRVVAALIVGVAGGLAGGLASGGEWTGQMARICFAGGCFVGALVGLKALELFHAI